MGGSEIMDGCGWWQYNYHWSWMVMGGGIKIMAGHGSSSWLVMDAHGWSHHLVMPQQNKLGRKHKT